MLLLYQSILEVPRLGDAVSSKHIIGTQDQDARKRIDNILASPTYSNKE